MEIKDIMTRKVISVTTDEAITKAASLMLQNRISGLPVLDKNSELVGIVTEGDFLRRGEAGAQRRRPKWLEFIVGPARMADEYVHAAGCEVDEIMTTDPFTVDENDTLEKAVELMERRNVKRLPVTRAGQMVGIVSRADLVRALVSFVHDDHAPHSKSDSKIRESVIEALAKQKWAPHVSVVIKSGVAELWGAITDERERQGIIVAVENVPGVTHVHDHLVWIEPMSGMAFSSKEDEATGATDNH